MPKVSVGNQVRSTTDPRWVGSVKKIYAGPVAEVRWLNGAFVGATEYIHCDDLMVVPTQARINC